MNKSKIEAGQPEQQQNREQTAQDISVSQPCAKPNVICRHEEICIITEIPTDGIVKQEEKVYVKCLLCNELLPIRLIEQRTIEVPLYGGI